MGTQVSLVRTGSSDGEIKDSIARALNLIDFKPKIQVKSVAVKANLCYYWDSATGETTDPRVVAGIIDCVREMCGNDVDIRVVEADATAMRTNHSFLMLGYEKLAKKKNIELLNLCDDNIDEKQVRVNGREIVFKVPRSLLESDLFINACKLKMHAETRMTCALKNIFGCIASQRKIIYHPFLEEAIVGINKVLRPDLTIVDGLIALGRFPVKLGLIMASSSSFSIDWVASQIIGYSPLDIKYLKIALKEKLENPKDIVTCGDDVSMFRKGFPGAKLLSTRKLWKTQLALLKLYAGITKDVLPPLLEET